MKRWLVFLSLFVIVLLACSLENLVFEWNPDQPPATVTSVEAIALGVSSPSPSETATIVPEQLLPTLPLATIEPSPTFTTEPPVVIEPQVTMSLQERLVERLASPNWGALGLSVERQTLWSDFAVGTTQVGEAELRAIEQVLIQWEHLENIAASSQIPADSRLGFRISESIDPQGDVSMTLYAIDEASSQIDDSERLFMVAHNDVGLGVGLVLAPQIESLNAQISPDGEFVYYLDPKGRLLLTADARLLNDGTRHQEQLGKTLKSLYGWSDFANNNIYPRYHYALPGVEASFYALEENLSYNQIVLLRETLELFDRPWLEAFKPAIFNAKNAFVIYDQIDIASGITYSGTGVIGIDRRDLFGNKYVLASVLAHEGAHVIQGELGDDATCNDVLRREIGDRTIPPGFLNWTAEELLQAVEDTQVGAYHVSLWILERLGLGEQVDLSEVIRTGMVNGISVVMCQP